MRLTDEELKGLYRRGTARTARPEAECLAAETLAAAAAGELSAGERERVADHLLSCASCAEEYRLLRPLREWATRVAQSDDRSAQPLDAVAPSRRLDERHDADTTPPVWWSRFGGTSASRLPYAVTAALLILCVALGVWVLSLRRERRLDAARFDERLMEKEQAIAAATESLAETRRQLETAEGRAARGETGVGTVKAPPPPTPAADPTPLPSGRALTEIAELRRNVERLARPQLNVPIFDLDPHGATRAGAQDAAVTIELPPGTDMFTLVLNVAGQPSFPGYELEIVSARGRSVWRGRGLRLSPYNTFTLALSSRLVPAGSYRLRLYGLRDSRRELVEDYAVRIRRR